MPFGFPDKFFVQPIVGALIFWQNDAEKKRLFGLELSKNKNAFEAACSVFPEDTSKALWASVHWLADPIVIDAKVNGLQKSIALEPLLDKEALCRKLLSFSDDKVTFNGNEVYSAEAKDRLKALELYAKIQGFIDQPDINNNNFINNEMVIKFVEPDKKEPEIKIIDNLKEEKEELDDDSPIKLKLVG